MTKTDTLSYDDLLYALAASPGFADDRLCFAARSTGLLRSTDGGDTWQDAYLSLNLQAALTTSCIGFSPDYADDHTVFAGAPGGVLRSTDGGQNWTVAGLPSPPPFLTALVVSPHYREDGLVFAATMEDGVLRSWDRGDSWAGWNFGLLDLSIYALVSSPSFADDETLFAGAESGVFCSTNGGRAWRETAFPIEYGPVLSLALSPAFATDQTLFAGTEEHGLFRSTDGGETWRKLMDRGDEPINELTLNTESGLWAIIGDAILRSRDGGQTWLTAVTATALGGVPFCMAVAHAAEGTAQVLAGSQQGSVRLIETT